MTNLPQIVIGCFLQDNQCVDKAIEMGCRAEMFGAYADLFARCVKARTAGFPFDICSIVVDGARMEEANECSDAAPTTSGFAGAVEQLIWNDKRSKLAAQAKDLISELKGSDLDDVDSISRRLSDMQQIAQKKEENDDKLADVIDAILADLDADLAGTPRSSLELSWGLPEADRYMLPIQQHELVIIAARPSMAKSSLALHVARTALIADKRVVIFTLETSKAAVLKQIASQQAGIDLRNTRSEPKDKIEFYRKCLMRLREMSNLLIFDRVTTLEGIEAKCRMLACGFKPHLTIIDYLGLIRVRGKDKLYEQISEVAKALIEVRKQLNSPMIALHQLNRGSAREEREPELHDLKDSSEIEQAACRAVFLYRPKHKFDTEQVQQAEGQMPPDMWHTFLLQRKLRDGPLANVRTLFKPAHTTFNSYASNTKF